MMRQNKTKRFITILNMTLLLLIAFVGYLTADKVIGAKPAPVPVKPPAAKHGAPTRNLSLSSSPSLSDYKAVWERNLFNTSQETVSVPKKQDKFPDVAKADKTIGLRLVGTVAGNASAIRFAVIENNEGQYIYHEGYTTGNYVIKKILRSNVIIASLNGDKLLALKSGDLDRGEVTLASSSQTPSAAPRRNRSEGRFRTVELPREEIMAGFDDIDRLIRKVGTSPYKFGRLTGFKIGSVSDKSILKKIGLRSHDKILAVNDKSIAGEKGAFKFFEQIAEGKKVTIKYRRRNRTRRIELNPV